MSRHAPRLHILDLFLGYDHESSFFQKGLLLGMVRLRKLEGFRLNETKYFFENAFALMPKTFISLHFF